MSVTATAATPTVRTTTAPPPPPPPGTLPPTSLPTGTPTPTGTRNESLRLRWAHWMENHLGRAYLPVTMAAGGLLGGALGAFTLGPIGGIAGAAGGALLAGALVFSD